MRLKSLRGNKAKRKRVPFEDYTFLRQAEKSLFRKKVEFKKNKNVIKVLCFGWRNALKVHEANLRCFHLEPTLGPKQKPEQTEH